MEQNNTIMHQKNIIILLFPLLLMNLLKLTKFPYDVRLVGDYSTTLTLIISFIVIFIYILVNRNNILNIFYRNTEIYIIILLLIIIYLISHIVNQNFYEDTTLLKLYLTFTFIILVTNIRWTREHVISIGFMASFVVLFFFLHWMISDFPTNKFVSITRNPNGLGIILYCLLFFLIIPFRYVNLWVKSYFALFILINLTLIYSSTSRSVFLALLVALFSAFVIKKLPTISKYLFPIVVSLMSIFVFLYVKLQDTKLGPILNEYSRDIFNKNFFSGRSDLWYELWAFGMNSPWIGHGIGIKAYEVTSFKYSAHNQFIQVFTETGFIGLIFFVLLLFFIWRKLIKRNLCSVSVWSAAFLLSIIVYQNLEYNLLINNPSLSLIQWLIICIGINFNEK